jgi:hypothetical protein
MMAADVANAGFGFRLPEPKPEIQNSKFQTPNKFKTIAGRPAEIQNFKSKSPNRLFHKIFRLGFEF